MDAATYIKEFTRMCKSFDSNSNQQVPCKGCPLDGTLNLCDIFDMADKAAECVAVVEKWAKEHPVKTRQSEFLKMFPSASIDAGAVCICPKTVAPEIYEASDGRGCIHVHSGFKCSTCRRDFWLTEISEGEAAQNAPEAITRCRDCMYSSRDKENNRIWCNYSTGCMETSVNGYCHHGKRREG